MSSETEPQLSLFRTALACRCPRCGKGKLYDGVLTVRPRCEVCGLDFTRAEPGDGGAVFVILILGAIITLLAVIVRAVFAPPLWVHLLLWIPATFAGAILLLRPIKAAFIAQQYRMGTFADEGSDAEDH